LARTRNNGTALDIGAFELEQPQISPTTLPTARTGIFYSYSQTITATATGGASGPFTFAVTKGALPPGLTLTPGGTLSGTLTQGGTFSFTITATDRDNDQGTQDYTLNVVTPTSISVSASSAATVYGQSVTLTATVTTPSGSPIPTSSDGMVTFYDGPKVLGTAKLSGSPATATLTTTALAAGPHMISAAYSGDSNFTASQSGVTPASVQAVVPATGLAVPTGVAVDGTGDVFIADPLLNQVVEFKPDGTQTTIGSGLSFPLGVAVDQSGNVFIADTGNNRVLEVTGGTQTTVASGLTAPRGVAVDNHGHVFFTDAGGQVFAITPMGILTTLNLVAFGFNQPYGVAVDSQGTLFIADSANNQVVELRGGTQTTVVAGLNDPRGVAVDSQGDLYIADTGNNRIVEVTPNGTQTTVGSGLNGPWGVTVDSMGGDVFVPDTGNTRVVEVIAGVPVTVRDPTSISVSASSAAPVYGQSVTLTATVTTPSGRPIPTSSDGTVTFYDGAKVLGTANLSGSPATATLTTAALTAGSHTITARYSGDSNFLASQSGVEPTTVPKPVPTPPLYFPESVAVDSAGDLFIADTGNNRIVEVSPNGTQTTISAFIQAIGGQWTASNFFQPYAVAVDGAGDLFITDGTGVLVEMPAGGLPGAIGTGLYAPPNVANDNQGDVFFADPAHNQVVELKADGTKTTVGSGLYAPYGVAVDAAGDVFIADSGNNRVVEVTAGLPVTVSPATPTVSVSDAGGTYNGNAFAATDAVAGVRAGVDSTPASTLEGVGLTLDYVQRNSNGTTTDLGSSAPLLPGSYSVTASFAGSTDYKAASNTTPFTIGYPMPSITPFLTSALNAGQAVGVPGQPLTDTFAINDSAPGIVFTIYYGDNTPLVTTAAGGPKIELDHIYTAPGSFTIVVMATDKYGVASYFATLPVTIGTVEMENDPSGGTALAVGGNAAGGDTILVSAADTTGTAVSVTFDNASLGTFTPTGHIFVYGQGGNDTITLNPYVVGNTNYYIQVPALLYGEGSGGDHISAAGSAANNVLTGHGSNEVLTGGQGRDLLIAGTGAATLNAGVGDDILIGGSTVFDIGSNFGLTYDQQVAWLDYIMAEWGSADSYATRGSALAWFLNPSTVHDNYASGQPVADQLLGNALANDWFFAGVNDAVTGKSNNAVVTSIT
jgi:serine/threonine-protein kinase